MEKEDRKGELSSKRYLNLVEQRGPILILATIIMHLVLVIFFTSPVTSWDNQSLERFGQLGDSFGILTATFTALAAWLAIVLLRQSAEGMRGARELMSEQLEQARKQSEIDLEQLNHSKKELKQTQLNFLVERASLQPAIKMEVAILNWDGSSLEGISNLKGLVKNLSYDRRLISGTKTTFIELKVTVDDHSKLGQPRISLPTNNSRSMNTRGIRSGDWLNPVSLGRKKQSPDESIFILEQGELDRERIAKVGVKPMLVYSDTSSLASCVLFEKILLDEKSQFSIEAEGRTYLYRSSGVVDDSTTYDNWINIYNERL